MNYQSKTIILLSAITMAVTISVSAYAQRTQQFVQNEAMNIKQALAAGAINQKQFNSLQNRAATLMYQEQQFLNQNGGTLNPQQKQIINNQTRQLHDELNQNIRKNNPSAYINNGNNNRNYRSPYNGYPNGYNAPYASTSGQNWQGNQNNNYHRRHDNRYYNH